MKHKDKTKGKHIDESVALRKSIDELEKLLTKSTPSEKALQRDEEIYRKLVEVCPDTVAIYSEGKFVFINKAGANLLLATNAEQLIGKPIKDFLHPDYRDKVNERFQEMREEKEGASLTEEKFVRLDGTYVDVEIATIPLTYQGKPAIMAIARDITERKQAEEQLKASLKEKEVLLYEIHHRVKNNMQIISSLFKLQAKKVKSKKMQEVFEASQSRIRSMTLVHEMLYESRDFAKVDLAHYIKSLAIPLFNTYRVNSNIVRLKTDVKDVFLDVHRAVLSALIVNELISNSLKYAFPKGRKGEICVKAHADKKGKVTLIVSDNGIGIPKKMDIQEAETLGLKLVTLLTEQLKGSIQLEKKVGTSFKITF